MSREEKSGFKAEIRNIDKSDSDFDRNKSRRNGATSDLTEKDFVRKQKSEVEDNYEDEFDEIDEDLPDNDLDMSANNFGMGGRIGESHGITVS